MFEIQLLLFQATLPVFTTFNLFLQRDDPQIYILYRQMQCLLKKLLSRFVKPSVIEEHKDWLSMLTLQIISHLFIDLTTASQIWKGLDDGDITEHHVKKFHSSVITFYTSSVAYVLQWFPFHDAIVKDSTSTQKNSVTFQWCAHS